MAPERVLNPRHRGWDSRFSQLPIQLDQLALAIQIQPLIPCHTHWVEQKDRDIKTTPSHANNW